MEEEYSPPFTPTESTRPSIDTTIIRRGSYLQEILPTVLASRESSYTTVQSLEIRLKILEAELILERKKVKCCCFTLF